jgi:plastocyanin
MKTGCILLSLGLWLATLTGAAVKTRADEVSGSIQRRGKGAAETVVYLEGARKAVPMAKAIVDQRDKTFLPHVSVVTVGTAIQFPNNDTVFHNVYAYFDAKKFDLGMYPRGAVKSVTFDKPGVVAVLCNVHSDMSAYIMVVDTPYFAITNKSGHFQINGVPPGTYTVHVWHESGAKLSQSFQVTAHSEPLNLTLDRK